METLLGLSVGVGLSAACGFRVFVPLLGMSIASMSGHVTLASGFEWIGTWTALMAFTGATALEVVGFYIPWLDNALDAVAAPAAVVAGTIMTASMVGDISPLLQWALAIIAGGGSAGVVQLGTTMVRGTSSTTTGGLGNGIVSTGELLGSIAMTLLAVLLPAVCFVVVVWVLYKMLRKISSSSLVKKTATS